MTAPGVALLIVLGLTIALACGPRPTLDAYDTLYLAPVKIAPEARLPAGVTPTALAADLGRALRHYGAHGGLFAEIHGDAARATTRTAFVETEILAYRPGLGLGLLGGRARGEALVHYAIRDGRGRGLASEDLRSIARSGPGRFEDTAEPLGLDPVIEGAGAAFHWWLRRNTTRAEPGERKVKLPGLPPGR